MATCEQIGELLSGYLDGELTHDKRQLVKVHLEQCAICRSVYEDIEKISGSVASLSLNEMTNNEWRKKMNDLTVRSSRSVGWLLFLTGIVVLTGYGIYEFAMTNDEPLGVKLAVAGVFAGLIGLFISVLRQRLIVRKTDKYKDVEI